MTWKPDIDHIHRLTDNLLSQGFYMYNLPERRIVWVNSRLKHVLNIDESTFFSAFAPSEESTFHDNLSKSRDLVDNTFGTFVYAVNTIYGPRWHIDRYTVYSRDEDGTPELILGIKADITEQKKQETNFRQEIFKLKECLSSSRIGTWEVNIYTNVSTWDDEMYRIHDTIKTPDEEIGALVRKVAIGDDFEKVAALTVQSMKTQTDFVGSYRIRNSKGEIRHLRCFGRFLEYDGRINLFGVTIDNTIQVEIENEVEIAKTKLISSAKMAALGEMSAGIAHEINNPLTVIQARAFQLNEMAETGQVNLEKLQEAAESISHTADRIAKIIKSLRTYAREGSSDPFDMVHVDQLVEETLEFCRAKFSSHGVNILVKPIDPDLEVECRLIQIEQVLLNLLNNAYDAIEFLPIKWIEIEVLTQDTYITISVTDSGTGLTPQIAEKLMQPFYTTKEVGKGTGLGLAISEGIALSHNGNLFFDPTSENTRFTLKLPKVQPS